MSLRLAELIGPVAGKLHTARSRNDQVVMHLCLYARRSQSIDALLARLQLVLAEKALAHAATRDAWAHHLQTAQPITFGHHLLAYAEMFGRDRERVADARLRLNELPPAALAGTGFAIDRDATAKALGFARASANSLDAVSDRDFALESLAAASESRAKPNCGDVHITISSARRER